LFLAGLATPVFGQSVHLSQALDIFLAPVFGEKPNPGKPPSLRKKDVIPFIRRSFENAIERVSKMTPEQISKTRSTDGGTMSGLEVVMAMLEHDSPSCFGRDVSTS
jgi:hypothetical protein